VNRSITQKLISIFLLATAMSMTLADAPAASDSTNVVELRGNESEQQILSTVAPPDAQLMHKIARVSLEPVGDCIVILFRASRESTVYQGKVLMHEPDELHWRVTPLPAMREADGIFDITVSSVFSVPQTSGGTGIAVLYTYIRLGAGEEPRNAGYAYLWDGQRWSIDRNASRRLLGVKTMTEARKVLRPQ
jgi:hypothetical protein